MRLRRLEPLPHRADPLGKLARHVEKLGEDEPDVRRGGLEHQLPAAAVDETLDVLDRELADARLALGDALVAQHRVQWPPVARVLGRIEMKRRPATRHGVRGDDDALRARERPGRELAETMSS